MDKVYVVMYGNIDAEDDILHTLFARKSDAVKHAEESAQRTFDDDPDLVEEGYIYEMTTDSDGNPICIMSLDGEETEWWRVVETKVW